MTDVLEIDDRESFEIWLDGLPNRKDREVEEWASQICHRAAMRVLPVFWKWRLNNPKIRKNHRLLDALRISLLATLYASKPTSAIAKLVGRGYLVNYLGTNFSNGGEVGNALAANDAAFAAVRAYGSTAAAGYALYKSEVAFGNFLDPDFIVTKKTFWEFIREDCQALLKGGSIISTPLFNENEVFRAAWTKEKEFFLSFGEHWGFWVDWYDRCINGIPHDVTLIKDVALIHDHDWEKSAEEVSFIIAGLIVKRISESRPLGEDEIDKGIDGLWRRTGRSDIDKDILEDALSSVIDEVSSIRGKLRNSNSNMYTALSIDLDFIDDMVNRCSTRPLRLYDSFRRVQNHLSSHIVSGELPDDVVVADLGRVLNNAAIDMCNVCEKTKAVVQARISTKFSELDAQDVSEINKIAEAAAYISDGNLAKEFLEDVKNLGDSKLSESEKKPFAYRLTTRLSVMIYRDGKGIVDAMVLLGGVGGGVAIFNGIISTIIKAL